MTLKTIWRALIPLLAIWLLSATAANAIFLSTDPVGNRDDPNLYMYAGLDPVNHTDPTGMVIQERMRMQEGRQEPHPSMIGGKTVWQMIGDAFRNDPVGATIITAGVVVDIVNTVVSPGPDATIVAAGVNGTRLAAREAGEAAAEGVVYRRTNTETGRCYIGRCNSDQLYSTRQRAHDRAQENRHEYEVVERAQPGRALREAEQRHIDANGGPTNRSNPNGGLENRRNEIDPRHRKP